MARLLKSMLWERYDKRANDAGPAVMCPVLSPSLMWSVGLTLKCLTCPGIHGRSTVVCISGHAFMSRFNLVV